jgi:hypothetical protein
MNDFVVQLGDTAFWNRLQENPAELAAEVCKIDIAHLDETLQKHAALRAWVSAAYETARIGEARLEWEDVKTRARLMLEVPRMDPQTGKPKTMTVINAEVELVPVVMDVMERLLAQQEVRGALHAMTRALEDRKDMLIQIAAKQRKEMDDYHH